MGHLKCKSCGGKSYRIIGFGFLYNTKQVMREDYFFQQNKCITCSVETLHKLPFVSKINAYRYIYLGDYNNQLHRHIMELVLKRPLLSTERVRFLNGQKGDVRPVNLAVTETKRRRNSNAV